MVLLELPERVNEPAAVSTSLIVKAIAPVGVSSLTTLSLIYVIVGASLTALTVNRKVSGVVFTPSLTFTVIVVVPD